MFGHTQAILLYFIYSFFYLGSSYLVWILLLYFSEKILSESHYHDFYNLPCLVICWTALEGKNQVALDLLFDSVLYRSWLLQHCPLLMNIRYEAVCYFIIQACASRFYNHLFSFSISWFISSIIFPFSIWYSSSPNLSHHQDHLPNNINHIRLAKQSSIESRSIIFEELQFPQ